jgi:protein involved in sex pheromone biosynthesis
MKKNLGVLISIFILSSCGIAKQEINKKNISQNKQLSQNEAKNMIDEQKVSFADIDKNLQKLKEI